MNVSRVIVPYSMCKTPDIQKAKLRNVIPDVLYIVISVGSSTLSALYIVISCFCQWFRHYIQSLAHAGPYAMSSLFNFP